MAIDLSPWGGHLQLVEQVRSGNRNQVWRGVLHGQYVAVRRSRRSIASLDWELDLMQFLDAEGFSVPTVIPATDGSLHLDGIVTQRWLDGRPPSSGGDWRLVADELIRLHDRTSEYPQRPCCCDVTQIQQRRISVDADIDEMPRAARSLVLGAFDLVGDVPTAVVHGDPNASNVRISDDGSVALLDWDESRVDLTWLDLAELPIPVLDTTEQADAEQLVHAWEASNAWRVEPGYAAGRLEALAALMT